MDYFNTLLATERTRIMSSILVLNSIIIHSYYYLTNLKYGHSEREREREEESKINKYSALHYAKYTRLKSYFYSLVLLFKESKPWPERERE